MKDKVKTFIKINYPYKYYIKNLKKMSNKIALEYNKNDDDVLNEICKYVIIKDKKFKFDIKKNNENQTYDSIKKQILYNKKEIESSLELNDIPTKILFDKNIKKKLYLNNNKNIKIYSYPKEKKKEFNKLTDDILNDVEKKRSKIFNNLCNVEYPEQKTQEWFDLRKKLLTASDGGTVVGLNPYDAPYNIIMKKIFEKKFDTNIDCYHGKKFEQAAVLIYENRMNVKIKDFGLCKHPDVIFLGASPDGIVSNNKSDGIHKTNLVGRLIEIKCPMRRQINMDEDAPNVNGNYENTFNKIKSSNGICPIYYWVQIQLQMQCCMLDQCDFFQCKIEHYDNKKDFLKDSSSKEPWISIETGFEKGVLIQILPIDINNMDYDKKVWNYAKFIYPSKIMLTPYELDMWILDIINNLKTTHPNMFFDKIIYWKLKNNRNITIDIDNIWFKKNLQKFEKIWEYINYFKKNKLDAKLINDYIQFRQKYYNSSIIKEKFTGEIMDIIDNIYKNDNINYKSLIKKEIDENNIKNKENIKKVISIMNEKYSKIFNLNNFLEEIEKYL